jgi:hypothetical protein
MGAGIEKKLEVISSEYASRIDTARLARILLACVSKRPRLDFYCCVKALRWFSWLRSVTTGTSCWQKFHHTA